MGRPITPQEIQRTLSPGSEQYTLFDGDCPGLMLRVGKRTSAYEIRMNRKPIVRVTVASTSQISLESAREITRRARAAHDDKIPIDDAWIAKTIADVGVGVLPVAVESSGPADGCWTVTDILRGHQEHLLAEGRTAATVHDAKKNSATVTAAIADRPAGEITAAELQAVLDAVASEKEIAARRGGEAVRRAWRWAAAPENRDRTGVHTDVAAGLVISKWTVPPPVGRQPDFFHPLYDTDIAHLIAVCRSGLLPGAAGAAIETICLTGLDPFAVVSAGVADIDGKTWTVPRQRIKRTYDLLMPTGPFAHVLGPHSDGEWLFPHHRQPRVGDRVHLPMSAISVALRQMPGRLAYNSRSIHIALSNWLQRDRGYSLGDLMTETAGLEVIDEIPRDGFSDGDVVAFRDGEFGAWRQHLEPLVAEAAGKLDAEVIRDAVAIARGR